jgi:uncharacterized lipoprotein YmbA
MRTEAKEMNNMNRTVRYIITFCFLIIAGCGSSPGVRYYALETIGDRVAQDDEGSPIIAVGAFRMPEYLNRSQMVSRGPGAEIIVDEFNRWAEPLDDAIHRVLASNLDVLLESVVVVAYPPSAVLNIDYRLTGRIDRFNSGQDGLVVLDVQWGIADSTGTVRLFPRRVRFESQATRPDDPGSMAQAMSDVLAQFCRDIAAAIDAVGLDPVN